MRGVLEHHRREVETARLLVLAPLIVEGEARAGGEQPDVARDLGERMLAVGRFDYTPIEGMSVPGRVIAPKGMGHLTKLAAPTPKPAPRWAWCLPTATT